MVWRPVLCVVCRLSFLICRPLRLQGQSVQIWYLRSVGEQDEIVNFMAPISMDIIFLGKERTIDVSF